MGGVYYKDAIVFGIGVVTVAVIGVTAPITVIMVVSWILEKIDDAIWERRRKQRQKWGIVNTRE